jgi:hypothetical protein
MWHKHGRSFREITFIQWFCRVSEIVINWSHFLGFKASFSDDAPSHSCIGVVIIRRERFFWDEDKREQLISGVTEWNFVLHETALKKFWQSAYRDTTTPSNTGLPSVSASLDRHFLCVWCCVDGCLTVSQKPKQQTGMDLGLGMLEWFHDCDNFLVSELWWAVWYGTSQFHPQIKSQDTHFDFADTPL